jgi:hypothetical protein
MGSVKNKYFKETEKWVKYIIKNNCSRKEAGKHFGINEQVMNHRIIRHGLDKDPKYYKQLERVKRSIKRKGAKIIRAKEFLDYILESECSRNEAAIHFNTTTQVINTYLCQFGFTKKYREELKRINGKSISEGTTAKNSVRETYKERCAKMMKSLSKVKSIKRNNLLDMAAHEDLNMSMQNITKDLNKKGIKVIY